MTYPPSWKHYVRRSTGMEYRGFKVSHIEPRVDLHSTKLADADYKCVYLLSYADAAKLPLLPRASFYLMISHITGEPLFVTDQDFSDDYAELGVRKDPPRWGPHDWRKSEVLRHGKSVDERYDEVKFGLTQWVKYVDGQGIEREAFQIFAIHKADDGCYEVKDINGNTGHVVRADDIVKDHIRAGMYVVRRPGAGHNVMYFTSAMMALLKRVDVTREDQAALALNSIKETCERIKNDEVKIGPQSNGYDDVLRHGEYSPNPKPQPLYEITAIVNILLDRGVPPHEVTGALLRAASDLLCARGKSDVS